MNYPRLNEFPEWFTVADDGLYQVVIDDQPAAPLTGAKLREGLFLSVAPNQTKQIRLRENQR